VTDLSSWNDTAARAAIEEFVTSAAEPRVAVFDNDGTLWCEKPIPIQLDFILRRWSAMAEEEASLRSRQPWKAAYERDLAWLGAAITKYYRGDDADVRLMMAGIQGAFEGMAVDAYAAEVAAFFAEAQHPTLGRPYRECGFLPMIDLLRHLEANGVATFIASGGDRDFLRAVSADLYGVPPERVIGSSYGLKWSEEDGLVYKGGIDVFDDGPEKPVRIWSRIGRRPALGCGNANGDVPMLRFSTDQRLLVVHDDAEREFDYTAGAEQALAQAFTKISVKDDWATVFA
jgi:hypothetical protein